MRSERELEKDSEGNLEYLKTFSADRCCVARLAVLQWACWRLRRHDANQRMRKMRANAPRPCCQERSVVRCRSKFLLQLAFALARRYSLRGGVYVNDEERVVCTHFICLSFVKRELKILSAPWCWSNGLGLASLFIN